MLIFQLASGSSTFEDHWSRASALPLLAHAPRQAHLQVHPHLPQALLLASGVPVNRLAHSFLKCISDFCQPSASHFKTHTRTHAHTPEGQERGKEVSGSPQTQRTSRGALTSLHCTQLPVFDYWLLWCLACTSAVGRRHCCLRSPCFQLSYLFFSFLQFFSPFPHFHLSTYHYYLATAIHVSLSSAIFMWFVQLLFIYLPHVPSLTTGT